MPKVLKDCLMSAAVGDIAGQPYEFKPCKDYDAVDIYRLDSRFTDDTVCTFACADALMNDVDMTKSLATHCIEHFTAGYAGMYMKWLVAQEKKPYNSFGNGSAMRCSAAGWLAKSFEEATQLAKKTAEVTHNHPAGILGAIAIAGAIYMLRDGASKKDVEEQILNYCYPDWKGRYWKEIQKWYNFDVTCQGSVPVAIICFIQSENFEDCMKKCIAVGGDADTLCAMAAPLAYAFYEEIPERLMLRAKTILPSWMLELNEQMNRVIGA